jgi:1A family penicillin-binding protein
LNGVTQHSNSINRVIKKELEESRAALSKAPRQLWWGLLAVTMVAAAVLTVGQVKQSLHLPDAKLPTIAELNRGVTIYDCHDKYVCTLRAEADRQAVSLSNISDNMKKAIIAAEDRRFYEHHGVDPIGIARALWRNHEAGRIVEGGSTITQQLVKNLYLDPKERSYVRKLKEAFLAWDVNSKYSKAKILETYLNVAYFGGGVCGVERAAQHYFNKHASELSVSESAYLAGLVKAPSDLSQSKNKQIALRRQKEVLAKMQEYGLITPAESKLAGGTKLAFKRGPLSRPWPHYIGCVEDALTKELGDDLWKGGWKVYTNLDVNAQKLAEATLNKGIKTAPRGIDQGALVSMSVKDGSVFAIVGGAGDYEDTQWNRAINPHTAGSAFKPFVYLAALAQGVIQPDTMINDAPLKLEQPPAKPYEPKNFDGQFKGWLTARTALATSRNVCAVRVAQEAGVPHVIEMAQNAGIRSQLDAYPALALGCCAVSPMEMATSYATIARGGVYMAPQLIRKIETDMGQPYRVFNSTPSANLPAEPTLQLLSVLEDVVKCGTGTRARLAGVAVAGKTGTANDSKDIWFVGTTPDVVTAVWAGNDKHKPVRGTRVTGGVVMAKIWHDYMSPLLKTRKPVHLAFTKPTTDLQHQVTAYADNQLFHESLDQTENGFEYNAAKLAIQVNNVGDLEMLEKKGIARAYDLQKLQAIKRLRNSYVAQNGNATAANPYNTTYSFNSDKQNVSAAPACSAGSQSANVAAYSQNGQYSTTKAWNRNGQYVPSSTVSYGARPNYGTAASTPRPTNSTVSATGEDERRNMIASSVQVPAAADGSSYSTRYASASNTIRVVEQSEPQIIHRYRIVTSM